MSLVALGVWARFEQTRHGIWRLWATSISDHPHLLAPVLLDELGGQQNIPQTNGADHIRDKSMQIGTCADAKRKGLKPLPSWEIYFLL